MHIEDLFNTGAINASTKNPNTLTSEERAAGVYVQTTAAAIADPVTFHESGEVTYTSTHSITGAVRHYTLSPDMLRDYYRFWYRKQVPTFFLRCYRTENGETWVDNSIEVVSAMQVVCYTPGFRNVRYEYIGPSGGRGYAGSTQGSAWYPEDAAGNPVEVPVMADPLQAPF